MNFHFPTLPDLAGPLGQLKTQATVFAPKLAAGLFILAGFWFGSSLLNKLFLRFSHKADPARQDILELLAQIARISLMVFGTVTAIGTLGVNVSALVAGLGLTGFALGFAFRDALSNILAGVLIVMYRPFLRGDQISVVGFEGTVVGIDLRYTTLQKDDKIFLIPNSTLFTNPIILLRSAAAVPVPAPVPGQPNALPADTHGRPEVHLDETPRPVPAARPA